MQRLIVPKLTLDLRANSVGDYTLILSEYAGGKDGIFLTQPFVDAQEVHAEFAKLEAAIAEAKQRALEMVTPDEQGVTSGQRAFADILKKADPSI